MRRWIISCLIAASCALPVTAQQYLMRMQSFTGSDGAVAFACISQPFVGAAAYVPSRRYPSGIAVIVVPEASYHAFLNRRYPSVWYAAAAADLAAGRAFTPAWRMFRDATARAATVPFEAEGARFGGIGSPRLPVAGDHDEADLAQVDAAIGNCDIQQGGRR